MRKNIIFGLLITVIFFSLFSTSCGDGYSDPYEYPEISYIKPTITENELILFTGVTKTLDWYYRYSGSNRKYLVSDTNNYSYFTVTSSNPSVISVGRNGVITARSTGYATITISAKNGTSAESSADINFYVSDDGKLPSLIYKMTLEKSRLTLYTDGTANLHYYLYSWDGLNYGGAVSVSSSNTNVCTAETVSKYAGYVIVKPVSDGSATLTVASKDNPNVKATCEIKVIDSFVSTYSVNKVTLSETEITIDKNETYELFATSTDSNGNYVKDSIKWTSDEPDIVTVSNGIITGVSSGTAIIKAKSKDNPNKFDICYVTVSNNTFIPVSSIKFSDPKMQMKRGERKDVSVSITPSNPSKPLDWSTSSNIISVSPDAQDSKKCTVTALAKGTCTLMAASSDGSVYATCTITVEEPDVGNANQYFWGTWIRMDKGTEIVVEENVVKANGKEYLILATSTETELKLADSIDGITSIKKETKNVMKAKIGGVVIPFYRKGGRNLGYTLQVVGFTDSAARAAGSLEGLKVKGKSNRFTSYDSEGTTDADGNVELTAPIQGDIQTVTIQVSDTKTVTIENLKIENDGTYMGKVPIVDTDDPVLKVSGYIEEAGKTDGYLYSGQNYIMNIFIKNISEVTAGASVLEIKPDNDSIISVEGIPSNEKGIPNPNAFTIPTLKPGITLERKIKISVNSFDDAYINTKLNVNIINSEREWNDYIPLRVYSEKNTFTVAASSPVDNENAKLNGFIIYPDGNSQYFNVKAGTPKSVYVPKFKNNESYMFVFSGAITEGELSETTELYYTLSFGENAKEFRYNNTSVTSGEVTAIMSFGEGSSGNDTEDTSTVVTSNEFEAYLAEGDTDFYTLKITN